MNGPVMEMQKASRGRTILYFMAVSPQEEYRGADPKGGEEKAFSGVHHPWQPGPGEQFEAAACGFQEIRATYHRPRECPCARVSPVACNRWNAFPRPGAVFSRLRPRPERCLGISPRSIRPRHSRRLSPRGGPHPTGRLQVCRVIWLWGHRWFRDRTALAARTAHPRRLQESPQLKRVNRIVQTGT